MNNVASLKSSSQRGAARNASKFQEPNLYRHLGSLAWPLILTQLAQVLLTTTDTIMMGKISVVALAAGGLAIGLFNQVRTMAVGLLTGVGNHISLALGEHESSHTDDREDISSIVVASFMLATTIGIISGAALVALGYLLPYLGQTDQVSQAAQRCMTALAAGYIPLLWFQVLRQFTVGMHKPKALLWITMVSIGLNVGLNFIFISGYCGLPRLGLTGIGISTSIVYLLTFLLFAVMVVYDKKLKPYIVAGRGAPDGEVISRIIKHGLPIAGTYGSEAGLFSIAALVAGSFGADTLAAHNAVNQITYVVFQVSVGLSHGSSLIISRWMGQGRYSQIWALAYRALSVSVVVIGILGIFYLFWPQHILQIFMANTNATAISIASVLLLFAAVQQFFDSAQNIGIGLLRGIGNTKSSFTITFIAYWIIGLPILLICTYVFEGKVYGVWIGLTCGLAVAAVGLWQLFYRSIPQSDLLIAPAATENR